MFNNPLAKDRHVDIMDINTGYLLKSDPANTALEALEPFCRGVKV